MKCNILIDWLTFSVRIDDPRKVISTYLGMDPDLFEDQPYGLMGYEKCKRFNDIFVLYHARENDFFMNMGVCVSMSGVGCRTFENMSSIGFGCLFELLHTTDCNVSRVDLALDDHFGYLDMDRLVDAVRSNNINSRIQVRRVVESYKGTVLNGRTVYIGSESSDFRLRIYDKAKEQGDLDSHWIRVELVMRGDHAKGFVDCFCNFDSVGQLAAYVLNDKIRFIDRDDINISRCSTCGWWVEFVGEIEALRLVSAEIAEHSVDQIEQWVYRQIAPALGMLYKAKGYLGIRCIIDSGLQRMGVKYDALLRDYIRLRQGMAVARA